VLDHTYLHLLSPFDEYPPKQAIYTTPVYADDYHPTTGHMHAVMHSDPTVIAPEFREQCLTRASNYVEVLLEG